MGKTRVIETMYFQGIEPIKILFDVDQEQFKSKVFDQWIYSRLMPDIKTKIKSRVTEVTSNMYEWIPVIEIEEMHGWGNHEHANAGFDIDRFYVAKRPDGTWLKTDWEVEDRSTVCHAFREKGFKIPCIEDDRYNNGDKKIFYVKYSDALWNALINLLDGIHTLSARLRDLVWTGEGQARLIQVAQMQIEFKEEKKS